MEATRLQMQNFLIFLLDLVGVTVGYFAAVWLRFGNIETGYTVMGNDTYYLKCYTNVVTVVANKI